MEIFIEKTEASIFIIPYLNLWVLGYGNVAIYMYYHVSMLLLLLWSLLPV